MSQTDPSTETQSPGATSTPTPPEAAPPAAGPATAEAESETTKAQPMLDKLGKGLKRPGVGAAIAGGAALAAVALFGVVETVVGGAVAYAAYRVLRRRRARRDAATA